MKIFFALLVSIALSVSLGSCSGGDNSNESAIADAEQAFGDGRYGAAMRMADSIIADTAAPLTVGELCRLSLLCTRLSEVQGDEQANTALAARALERAFALDSDSTTAFIRNVPVDDRARISIVRALAAPRIDADSLIEEPDSIYY